RRHAVDDARAGGGAIRVRDRQRWSEEAARLAGILRIGYPGGGAVAVAAGIRGVGGAEGGRAGPRVAAREIRGRRCSIRGDRGRDAYAGPTEVEAAAHEVEEIGPRVVDDGAAVAARRRQAGREGEAARARAAAAAGSRAGRGDQGTGRCRLRDTGRRGTCDG